RGVDDQIDVRARHVPDVGRQHLIDVGLPEPCDPAAGVLGGEPRMPDGQIGAQVVSAPAASDAIDASDAAGISSGDSVCALSRITSRPAATPRTPPRPETNRPIAALAVG